MHFRKKYHNNYDPISEILALNGLHDVEIPYYITEFDDKINYINDCTNHYFSKITINANIGVPFIAHGAAGNPLLVIPRKTGGYCFYEDGRYINISDRDLQAFSKTGYTLSKHLPCDKSNIIKSVWNYDRISAYFLSFVKTLSLLSLVFIVNYFFENVIFSGDIYNFAVFSVILGIIILVLFLSHHLRNIARNRITQMLEYTFMPAILKYSSIPNAMPDNLLEQNKRLCKFFESSFNIFCLHYPNIIFGGISLIVLYIFSGGNNLILIVWGICAAAISLCAIYIHLIYKYKGKLSILYYNRHIIGCLILAFVIVYFISFVSGNGMNIADFLTLKLIMLISIYPLLYLLFDLNSVFHYTTFDISDYSCDEKEQGMYVRRIDGSIELNDIGFCDEHGIWIFRNLSLKINNLDRVIVVDNSNNFQHIINVIIGVTKNIEGEILYSGVNVKYLNTNGILRRIMVVDDLNADKICLHNLTSYDIIIFTCSPERFSNLDIESIEKTIIFFGARINHEFIDTFDKSIVIDSVLN